MAAQADGDQLAGPPEQADPERRADRTAEQSIPTRDPAGGERPAATLPQVGDAVVISRTLPYLKTADPMPMLRPPDLVDSGEVGQVRERRAADVLAVRFRRGTFLLAAADLRPAAPADG